MHAWALVTPDVEKLELPEPLLAADVRAVGVAAVAEQGDGARIAVMLLISRE
jgi:predicted RNA-binding protein with TRAM domain